MGRLIVLALLLFVLSGCKLAVILVEGGEVQSVASGTCVVAAPGISGAVCIHEVTDTNFAESFTAVPATGWQFVKWNAGDGFLCADSTDPVCIADNTSLAGNPVAEAVIASDQTFYIMPIFTKIGAKIIDTVTVNGVRWAQPQLFSATPPFFTDGTNWDSINAICPLANNGVCNVGALNGWDMDGWTWASAAEVGTLLFSEVTPHPGGIAQYQENNSAWGPNFLDPAGVGFNLTFDDGFQSRAVTGRTRDVVDAINGRRALLSDAYFLNNPDIADTTLLIGRSSLPSTEGAWFYRVP